MKCASALFVVVFLAASATAAGVELRVVTGDDKRPVAVEALGLTSERLEAAAKSPDVEATQTLSVFVVDKAAGEDPPAMLGEYSLAEGRLRFTPKYGFRPGLAYRAVLRLDKETVRTLTIDVPAPKPSEPAKVVAVYPSAAVLPDNQLRFYLHFSAPMSRGEAYQHLALLDEKGQPVKFPFLEIGEELWDRSGQRLTLLIDPGRIKRGLRPREEDGPVLMAGHKYTLVVAKGWLDAAGQPLATDFKKAFAAGPPIESGIDPKAWQLTPPPAGSREPLVVQFPRPLDRALLERTITVADSRGKPVAGAVEVAKEERQWQFRPDQPWPAGKLDLAIDTALEDLAGNRIGRPFEVDQFHTVDQAVQVELVRLPFEIRSGGR